MDLVVAARPDFLDGSAQPANASISRTPIGLVPLISVNGATDRAAELARRHAQHGEQLILDAMPPERT